MQCLRMFRRKQVVLLDSLRRLLTGAFANSLRSDMLTHLSLCSRILRRTAYRFRRNTHSPLHAVASQNLQDRPAKQCDNSAKISGLCAHASQFSIRAVLRYMATLQWQQVPSNSGLYPKRDVSISKKQRVLQNNVHVLAHATEQPQKSRMLPARKQTIGSSTRIREHSDNCRSMFERSEFAETVVNRRRSESRRTTCLRWTGTSALAAFMVIATTSRARTPDARFPMSQLRPPARLCL